MKRTFFTSFGLLVLAYTAALSFGHYYPEAFPHPQFANSGDAGYTPETDVRLLPSYPNIVGNVTYGADSDSFTTTASFATKDKADMVLRYYEDKLAFEGWTNWGPKTPVPNELLYWRNASFVHIKLFKGSDGVTNVSLTRGLPVK